MFERLKVNALKEDIAALKEQKEVMEQIIGNLKNSENILHNKVNELEGRINIIEIREEYSIPYYHNNLSELGLKRDRKEKELDSILQQGLWNIEWKYTLNGSVANGANTQKAFADGMIYALNAYIYNKEKSITAANCDKTYDLIVSKFNQLNHKAEKVGIKLNERYVHCRIELMKINLAIKVKEKEEKQKSRKKRSD